MGSGKSSAAITYMNENPEKKFVYITPYLDEASRITRACPELRFVEPSDKIPEYGFKKTAHTAALIEEGRNVATTHQAFKAYTPEMLEAIKSNRYTLIIDENVDVLDAFSIHPDDIKIAVESGYITEQNGVYVYSGQFDEYHGDLFSELKTTLTSRNLIQITDMNQESIYYWTLPADLLAAFADIYILTYMFVGHSLRHFLVMNKIPYAYIGVRFREGAYRFCGVDACDPFGLDIESKVHIVGSDKMNRIGEDFHSISMNWFARNAEGTAQLKRHLGNFFNNICRGVPADRRLWGTYKDQFNNLRGRGYSGAFLPFNTRATNTYKERFCLAYIVNLFMNVGQKAYYNSNGVDVDQEMFALSTMVQWIWRSQIREGKEINLYIPSKRMRDLLTDWMAYIKHGGTYIEESVQ